MKVLFAGTPGVRKSVALENLRIAIEKLDPRERVFITQNLPGDPERVPVLDHLLYRRDPITFLQQPEEAQKRRWRETFAQLRHRFDGAEKEHHFLGVHLTYRFEQTPSCVVSFADLADWRPNCIVTLIDDAYCVRQRIHNGGYTSFTLAELILWRAEEVLIGDLLARVINPKDPPPNYVVSVKHPADMLARLLLRRQQTARVYLSHDISDARKEERHRRAIDRFRTQLRKKDNCAVFEPLTIDELPPILGIPATFHPGASRRYDPYDIRHRWPTLDPSRVLAPDDDLRAHYPLQIPCRELSDVRLAINAQVERRDIRLVNQSHYLLVYRPTLTRDAKLGSGVLAEVRHARDTGCPIIWYFKKGDPIPTSPFVPKSSADNPNFIHEATETKLWEKLETLHESLDPTRDHFLR
jgi:hypothetical protein